MSGTLRGYWLRWKSLRLPWRRQFLVGMDLAGNTFWEFKETRSSTRLRRIAKYPRNTPYSDIKITPQWHQWLRHTREHPPTINEQQLDEIRQARIKQLAQAADERWRQKVSYIEPPSEQPSPGFKLPNRHPQTRDDGQGTISHIGSHEEVRESSGDTNGSQTPKTPFTGETRERGPWEIETGKNPGGQSGDEAWKPKVAKRR